MNYLVSTCVSCGWGVLRLLRWRCILEQEDEHRSISGRLACVCHMLVRLTQSLALASAWSHSTHHWPGVGRTVRGPLYIVQRCAKDTLGSWPTYWMLSRWQRDDALMCSLGSEYLWGYLGRVRLSIVCKYAYMHHLTSRSIPWTREWGVRGGRPKCTDHTRGVAFPVWHMYLKPRGNTV